MPSKKLKKKVEIDVPEFDPKKVSRGNSDTSDEIKPKKKKSLTKKEIERMRRLEKDMKAELEVMIKEAETKLAEFNAMAEAAKLKAQEEEEQQNFRIECLTNTCNLFRTAKLRVLHENNKIREEEIWDRYITTNQMPYPESPPSMYTHLYIWQQCETKENIELALNRCDSYIETLDQLDELIEYPLYSPKKTVNNWKELRTKWRREFLTTIDKSCFHMIKNLSKHFEQGPDLHVHSFDFQTEHISLYISAWTENKNTIASVKWTPKIVFKDSGVEVTMPYEYRTKPFILRLVRLDRDFFSDDSLTSSAPQALPMEANLLNEIKRCFEVKKEAKESVADREREKVNAAKQKVLETQEVAIQAERSFRALQEQTKALAPQKPEKVSVKSESGSADQESKYVEQNKKPKESLGLIPIRTVPDDPSTYSGSSKRRGKLRDFGSNASILMQNVGAMKSLDTISMRSGMRKKLEKPTSGHKPASVHGASGVFKVLSMTSVEELSPKTVIRKDSALCFEETEGSEMSVRVEESHSYDSLDLLLGNDDYKTTYTGIPTLRQLIKDTVIVEREPKQQSIAQSKLFSMTYSFDGRRGKGRKGKSMGCITKKMTDDDEMQPMASEIFDAKEEFRQDRYLSSLCFMNIPMKRFHLNLRMYSIVGGTYLLDLISHVSQPHPLPDGATVQIFYGEMNIQRDKYEYKYTPPPPLGPDEDLEEPPLDPGLKHLLHVKVPLPKHVVYYEHPIVALWDMEAGFWTNEYVHNLETDMATKIATFSLSRVMPFAFCIKKFSMMPYTSWNLKPKSDGGGTILSIRSTLARLEFHVLLYDVCLTNAMAYDDQNIPEVQDIIGKYMHIHKLIAAMKSRGVNVFPDEDACIYTENAAKDPVLEDHTNFSIAMWSDYLEFQGCEWNGDFKRRKLAFRVREFVGYNMDLRYRTVVASSLSASIYRLGNEDAAFDESRIENYGFCPDVMNLLEKAFIHVSPTIIDPPSPLQILTVYTLLARTKVLSFFGITRKETPSSSSEGSKRSIKKRPKKLARQKSVKKAMEKRSSGEKSDSMVSSDNPSLTL